VGLRCRRGMVRQERYGDLGTAAMLMMSGHDRWKDILALSIGEGRSQRARSRLVGVIAVQLFAKLVR
jgi:hypothetical protein